LHRVRDRTRDVAAALIEEAERLKVDLMVMGGYGHSRLREMLLGGVTYDASRFEGEERHPQARRALTTAWASFCSRQPSKIVQFRA
jgi:hypothetical protein